MILVPSICPLVILIRVNAAFYLFKVEQMILYDFLVENMSCLHLKCYLPFPCSVLITCIWCLINSLFLRNSMCILKSNQSFWSVPSIKAFSHHNAPVFVPLTWRRGIFKEETGGYRAINVKRQESFVVVNRSYPIRDHHTGLLESIQDTHAD